MVGRRSDNEHQGRLERPCEHFERPHIAFRGLVYKGPDRIKRKSAGFCQIGFRESGVHRNLRKVGHT